MREPNDSWWRKIERAENHLEELRGLLAQERRVRPQLVVTRLNATTCEYEYGIQSLAPPTPEIAVVLGDFLFDLRSALDHMAVALADPKDRYSVSFPILQVDPWERQGPRYVQRSPEERRRWRKCTRSWPSAAADYVASIQPYNGPKRGREHHYLSVLSRLNNSDKHRDLVPVTHRLTEVRYWVPSTLGHETCWELDDDRSFLNGSTFLTLPDDLEVRAEAGIEVGVRTGERTMYELPRVCDELIRFVGDEVLPALDLFIPS